jgi:hypothetical protein
MRRHYRSAIRNRGCAVALLLAGFCGCSREAGAPARQPATARRPITVCELLKNPLAYRGKMVTVVGIYWYGLRQSCAEPLVTAGHTWPSAIAMVDSDFPAAYGEPVPFRTDTKSWDRLYKRVREEAAMERREEIWVTAVGLLQAPASYVNSRGQVVVGYLGVFPAQLVVKRIVGISIRSNPTYDYRELLRPSR